MRKLILVALLAFICGFLVFYSCSSDDLPSDTTSLESSPEVTNTTHDISDATMQEFCDQVISEEAAWRNIDISSGEEALGHASDKMHDLVNSAPDDVKNVIEEIHSLLNDLKDTAVGLKDTPIANSKRVVEMTDELKEKVLNCKTILTPGANRLEGVALLGREAIC